MKAKTSWQARTLISNLTFCLAYQHLHSILEIYPSATLERSAYGFLATVVTSPLVNSPATMTFLLSISSSIGKKILLSALHHVDILDKDPSDFVDLAVGKKTTLEIRDVGLRVKARHVKTTCLTLLIITM